MIKVIIIDDEKLARDIILAFLKPYQRLEVVATCENGFEGIKAIVQHQPDLVFLDVQMPKLNGFEMLELLDKLPMVIFSTAYDNFAIKAFELSAADYLLKPYSQKRFNEAVEKALHALEHQITSKNIPALLDSRRKVAPESLDRIVVRHGNKIIIIPSHTIECIEAADDYVVIHSEGRKILKQITMKYLEDSLPSAIFVRVHRSYIINIEQIDKIEAYSKDGYVALLKNGIAASVSRTGYNNLKTILNF